MFDGWQFYSNHVSQYNGRILIIWRADYYKLRVRSENAQAVTCAITFVPLQMEFLAIFVYAYNSREERRELWEYLCQIAGMGHKPWITMGDFNSVLHAEDSQGVNPVTINEVIDFHSCLDVTGLTELPSSGCSYTWNDKHESGRIFSRIDWVLLNGEWMDNLVDCRAKFLPEGVSDHSPIQITIAQNNNQVRKTFRYSNMWSSHPRNHFSNIVEEVAQNRANLLQSQEELQKFPLNTALKLEEKTMGEKVRRSSYLAEIFLQQRSKTTWIRAGDDNTSYFFSVIKHRKLMQAATQLHDHNDQMQHEPDKIANIFVHYYKQLLGEKGECRGGVSQ
ncbi:PREDICTED: uncharacterized protein LOC109231672 [Nicotiana attenuata]|uniref:uncharacterized protein LOC109231672 n=1 Tax=Nicotiana attenuata TaxID=49451 RepID=UPI000904B1AF|nr:PREDICTED: uncharacterized protein LOC109231672 [Nicotiana attenuata]